MTDVANVQREADDAEQDYGSATVTETCFGTVESLYTSDECSIEVERAPGMVDLTITMSPFDVGLSLSAEESAALREELRYAEQQVTE